MQDQIFELMIFMFLFYFYFIYLFIFSEIILIDIRFFKLLEMYYLYVFYLPETKI